jgi:hypothetical protein
MGPVGVPGVDEGADLGVEVFDGAEGAASDGLPVDDPKKTSTRFSHDPDVGVKCTEIRGLATSQAFTSGRLWVA